MNETVPRIQQFQNKAKKFYSMGEGQIEKVVGTYTLS